MTSTLDAASSADVTDAPRRFTPWGGERVALAGLLAATAALYLWGLGASGWANSFYSAAVQAGSVGWKAFFFGSSDAANSITVDKTPLSLWVMVASVRLFGLNSWSILVPQALMGVASVALVHATVRRRFGAAAALIAGAVLALTPVAVLMFRFNNPDALLVLLMIGAVYATLRALETASTRWLVLAGALVGLGFLAKMLQVFLVLPSLVLVYLVAAPTSVRRRLFQLVAGLGALVVAGGWWVVIVELIPASARPYIGGSQNNSVIELALGYNGLGRLNGDETGSVGGGGGRGGPNWGQTGWLRMFGSEIGGQIAWLLPAALVLLVAGLWLHRRAPRGDPRRAAYLVWGGWLLVHLAVFSYMAGIFHAYYTVALAPAIGALVGMGSTELWRRRRHPAAAATLALTLAVTTLWAWQLLGRSPSFHPGVRAAVAFLGLAAALGVAVSGRFGGRAVGALGISAMLVALTGPAAYAVQTAATPHGGALPSAGPQVSGGFGPGGRRGGPGGAAGFRQGGGPPAAGGRGFGPPGGAVGGARPGRGAQGGLTRGGLGGLLDAGTPSDALVSALRENASQYTWVAAAVGSNSAAGVQLATGLPVMPVGGFNGSDPSPTLEQFQRYVAAGRIHYFLGGGGMRPNGGSRISSEIASWVSSNFEATTIGGVTVYDLTRAV